MEDMAIMKVEPLVWKFSEPASFPCMVCGVNRATKKVHWHKGYARYTICACRECSELEVHELAHKIFEPDGN
jgi:hypothetical protein